MKERKRLTSKKVGCPLFVTMSLIRTCLSDRFSTSNHLFSNYFQSIAYLRVLHELKKLKGRQHNRITSNKVRNLVHFLISFFFKKFFFKVVLIRVSPAIPVLCYKGFMNSFELKKNNIFCFPHSQLTICQLRWVGLH